MKTISSHLKQTLTTSKHSIEFTYSDFPGHFNRTAINQRWLFVDGSVRGKRLTITANFQERNLGTALSGKKIRPVGRIVKGCTGLVRVISQSNSRI